MSFPHRPADFLAMAELIGATADTDLDASITAAADQAHAFHLDAAPGLALFGLTNAHEVQGGPRVAALMLATFASWRRNGGVRCPHLASPTVTVMVPGAGVMACTSCLPRLYTPAMERERHDNGRCDVCGEPSDQFTGHSHQAGPFLIPMDLCNDCHAFALEDST